MEYVIENGGVDMKRLIVICVAVIICVCIIAAPIYYKVFWSAETSMQGSLQYAVDVGVKNSYASDEYAFGDVFLLRNIGDYASLFLDKRTGSVYLVYYDNDGIEYYKGRIS